MLISLSWNTDRILQPIVMSEHMLCMPISLNNWPLHQTSEAAGKSSISLSIRSTAAEGELIVAWMDAEMQAMHRS